MHRIAIELVNPGETEVIVSERAARQAWLEARGYKVISMTVADVERDLETELAKVEASLVEQR